MAVIEQIQPATLTDQVYRRMKSLIIEKEFNPGEPLVVSQLAKRLGTSLTPVRETLRWLEKDGLVDFVPNKGATVVQLTRQRAEDLFAVRALLEAATASQAAERVTAEGLRNIERAFEKGRSAAVAGDDRGWIEADGEFHRFIALAANNPYLTQMIGGMLDHVQLFRKLTVRLPGSYQLAASEHEAVMVALRHRDPIAAGKAMREHVVNSLERGLASSTLLK